MEKLHRPFQAHQEAKSWFQSLTDHLGEASASYVYLFERPSVRSKMPNFLPDPKGARANQQKKSCANRVWGCDQLKLIGPTAAVPRS